MAIPATQMRPGMIIKHNDKLYIADGHHRLTADWLDGKETAEVHYKDLTKVNQALKSAE